MTNSESRELLVGVIEGFYGQPWAQAERFELFERMRAWGLNTYMYAPKDDLKHRAVWRELYSELETALLRELIRACGERKLRFIYAISPGLDIRYTSESDLQQLQRRLEQMIGLGCENFCLLFDDIPDRMDPGDLERFGSLASAQSYVSNAIFKRLREQSRNAKCFFCPTPYCGRMVANKLGGEDYLPTIGRELLPEIEVFWTGPEIISQRITVEHIRELQATLRRKPVIWDNLHANDYDGRRFFCGPYSGRAPELRNEVNGFLSNPNCEFALNFVPIRTLAQYAFCDGRWDAREAYLSAMREWLPHFATVCQAATLEDLVLFGDCYYLPYGEGPEAGDLYQRARDLMARDPAVWGDKLVRFREQAARLLGFCVRLTELRDRRLFYALSRRVWELREELDLLDRFVAFKSDPANGNLPFTSPFHLPGTYCGGLVARLQKLLVQHEDGIFVQRE